MQIDNILLRRDDLTYRYSKTAQALNAQLPKRFDAVIAEALTSNTKNNGRDTLLVDTAQKILRDRQAVAGYNDPVFTSYSRNGGLV